MANSVSSEKLLILDASGGTLCTAYAGGRLKSGMIGLAFGSANGPAHVGCIGSWLQGSCQLP